MLASMLVVATGVAFIFAGGLRLGAMSNLIARPVLRELDRMRASAAARKAEGETTVDPVP